MASTAAAEAATMLVRSSHTRISPDGSGARIECTKRHTYAGWLYQ